MHVKFQIKSLNRIKYTALQIMNALQMNHKSESINQRKQYDQILINLSINN